jgi:predicted GNAT family N-acyltransferase
MIESKWVFGRENLSEVIKVRMAVFRDELGHDIITDADDGLALHVLVGEDGVNYAAGRIYDKDGEFYIGMICVDQKVRGKQLGSLVVKVLISRGFSLMADKIHVNSRACAVGFYEKLGFETCGDEYTDINGEKTVPMVLLKENSPVEAGCSGCAGCGGSCEGCG